LRDLPGYELFQYVDEQGVTCSVGSTDVNDYLRQITADDFTAKDFRTWGGTAAAVEALCACEAFTTQKQARKNIVRAVEHVAERLGNTVAVCKKCYVHPAVFEHYMNGTLVNLCIRLSTTSLSKKEKALIRYLEKATKPKMTVQEALERSIRTRKKK
jgi:DNA topoisomerase-1